MDTCLSPNCFYVSMVAEGNFFVVYMYENIVQSSLNLRNEHLNSLNTLLNSPIHSEQSRTEQSSSLLPATSQHSHSWHRAPLGPMAIYLFNVKTFVFYFFRCSPFDKKGGGWTLFYNWCSLTTPFSTRGHIKVRQRFSNYGTRTTSGP
jgi:hypothetical protein